MRILAAPEDALFCVGDEDQTLYGLRRASVRRMLELDLAYPGLQRVSLAHNYRCPPEIVAASRAARSTTTRCASRRDRAGARPRAGARRDRAAPAGDARPPARRGSRRALPRSRRGEIVVLARTTNLLRTVALACADRGVRISAPRGGVRAARRARWRSRRTCGCAARPTEARAEDVALVCRAPNRGLPYEAEERGRGAAARRASRSRESFAALAADDRQRLPSSTSARRASSTRSPRSPTRAASSPTCGPPAASTRTSPSTRRRSAGPSRSSSRSSSRRRRRPPGMTVAAYSALLERAHRRAARDPRRRARDRAGDDPPREGPPVAAGGALRVRGGPAPAPRARSRSPRPSAPRARARRPSAGSPTSRSRARSDALAITRRAPPRAGS